MFSGNLALARPRRRINFCEERTVATELRSLASASLKTERHPMTLDRKRSLVRTACQLFGLIALIVGDISLNPAAAKAQEEPGGGGISSNRLWVNARLGQPTGGTDGRAGGPMAGRSLRYIRLGAQAQCTPVTFQAPAGIQPWFGF